MTNAHDEDVGMDRDKMREPIARIRVVAGPEEAEFEGRDAEMFALLWRDIEQARAINVGKVVLHLGGEQVKLEFRINRPGMGQRH